MDEKKNSNHILEEQKAKKEKALQELKELQALLEERDEEEKTAAAPTEDSASHSTEEAKPEAAEHPSPTPKEVPEEETILLETDLFRKAQEEQRRQEEAARQERIRRTSAPHHRKSTAGRAAGTHGSHAETAKSGRPRPVRKISRKEMERRRKARLRRRIIRLGGLCVIVLAIVIAAACSINKSRSAGADDTTKSNRATAQSASKQKESKQEKTEDSVLPASKQKSEQYLAIKDDDSLPSYAKKYPGLYADSRNVETKESDKKVCYLTFDDGPSDTVTPSVLDTLKKYDVKATFFLVASQIPDNEKLVKRMIKEGHTVCIHAYVHEYSTIYESVESYLKDFAKAYDEIYSVTGYRVQGFRFPGGSNNAYMTADNSLYDAIVTEMTRRGFEYYDWNAYDGDAEGSTVPAPSSLASRAIEEVSESSRNDVIVLMHDTYGKENTASALPSIIEGLKAKNIEMLPLTQSSRPVHFEVNDNTPSEYSGVTEDTTENSTTSTTETTTQ